MHTQTVQFAVEKTKNGQIKTIGKSVIEQSEINFSSRSVKWFEDKLTDSNNKSSGGSRKCRSK